MHNHRMIQLMARWVFVPSALIAMACGGSDVTGPTSEENAARGTYRLTSVRASPVPVALFGQCSLGASQPCSACSASATSGSVTLETGAKDSDPNPVSVSLVASGPCVDPLGRSPTTTSSYTTSASGTWTTSGTTITFSMSPNAMGISSASLSGSTLSMSFNWLNADSGGQPASVTAVFAK